VTSTRIAGAPRTSVAPYARRRGLFTAWLAVLVSLTTAALPLVATAPAPAEALGMALTDLTLSLSSDAASATEVTYTIGFAMPAGEVLLAGKGQITLDAPTGTFAVAHRTCAASLTMTMTDLTTATSRGLGTCATTNADDSSLSITSPINVGAGDRAQLMVPTLDNPAQVGLHLLSVGTSAGGTASVGFQIVKAGAISGLSLS
jgi:hypothetical protein